MRREYVSGESHYVWGRRYRMELKARLPALVAKWEAAIGVRASAVRVKNMRTRWRKAITPCLWVIWTIFSRIGECSRRSWTIPCWIRISEGRG